MMLMTTLFLRFALVALLLSSSSQSGLADQWGTLSGRITVNGNVPKPETLQIVHDEEFCGPFRLKDESLHVNSKNGGLANVVVWLSSKEAVPIHPSRQDTSQPVLMDNKDCRFVPRMIPLRTKQMLHVTNSDSIPHNVSIYGRRNLPINLQVPNDEPLKKSFSKPELLPIRVDCSSHAWMRAYLVITDHGCVAITDKDGRFEIPNVPFGKWEFRMWHERPGYLNQVVINSQVKQLKRGTVTVVVDNEKVSTGHINVSGDIMQVE